MEGNKSVDDIIDNLIEQVIIKYTPERIKSIKERMESFWYRKSFLERMPYALVGLPLKQLPEMPENVTQNEKELIIQLQTILEHSEWDDDFYPALSPGIKQITIPSYFGCVEEVASASTKVKPIIDDPKDVYQLPEIGFVPGTEGGDMLEKMRYFYKRTRGLLPIYETDMQGPFSVASQIWGIQEFLLAIYEYPDEVHYLLQRCTDVIIKYIKLMYEAVEGNLIPFHCMPVFWYPTEKGVAVSEDLAAVVSPKIVREFIRPYLEQIADAFGGIFMHSCGSINSVIGELNQIRGLVGLNFASTETDLEKLAKDVNPEFCLVVHNSPVSRIDLPLLNQDQHIELCRKVFGKGRVHGACIIFPWNAELDLKKHAEAFRKAVEYK